MKPQVIGLVALAVVFLILAALYAVGAISFLASTSSGPHIKHAIALGVLAVVALVAANFVRTRTTV